MKVYTGYVHNMNKVLFTIMMELFANFRSRYLNEQFFKVSRKVVKILYARKILK